MGLLTNLPTAVPPKLFDMQPVVPFNEGSVYDQVDLDGRDGVVGLASHFLRKGVVGYFAARMATEIDTSNENDPGSYAIYIDRTELGQNPEANGTPLAMVYRRRI